MATSQKVFLRKCIKHKNLQTLSLKKKGLNKMLGKAGKAMLGRLITPVIADQ